MKYYFCNACHYCFTDSHLPDRCPDCGKQTFRDSLAVRPATAEEIADYNRIQKELEAENEGGKQ